MYLDAAAAAGFKAKYFVIIAVESEARICVGGCPTHGVSIYALSPATIDQGAREISDLLAIWAFCEDTNTWATFNEAVQDINLPPWRMKRIEEERDGNQQ